MSTSPDPSLPPNLPIVNLRPTEIGTGWTRVEVGTPIKTSYQLFAWFVDPPDWVISSFFTSDKEKNSGRQVYRRATSLRAWISILPSLTRKYLRRWAGKV